MGYTARMLSIFPDILFLSLYGTALIRVALAVTLAYSAWRHFEWPDITSRFLAGLEILTAALIVAGAWTQPAALVSAIIAAIWYFQPTSRVFPVSTIFLAFVISLSLILTGPGALAFDLPL